MSFRTRASIDPNQHKGLVILDSIAGTPLIATGLSLTNAQPLHVAVVDASGSQVTSFGGSGSVSITSITPGTATSNLGKAEDSPHNTGDVGVEVLAVRNDTGSVLAGSDGDYVPMTTDSTGALRIDMNGTISTSNSTTATLTGGSVFTGVSEDCTNYNEIRISIIASHVSATDGLSIQQSMDNTNWDITDVYSIPAATGKTFSVPRQAHYFRIVYTNGGTGQSYFRLQTILNRVGTKSSSQRTSDNYSNENDLEEIWAFNSVLSSTGIWDRAREVVNATDSVGVGIAASGILGQFDDVSPGTVTENRFGNIRMSVRREIYGQLRDAAGNERGANVDANNRLLVSDSGLYPTGTALNTYAVRITTNTTTTPTSSTAYISSIVITTEVGGTTSTVTIRDKQGTPQILINGLTTTAASLTPTVINFQTPVKMTSGIDVITAGAVAGTVDVWINYFA